MPLKFVIPSHIKRLQVIVETLEEGLFDEDTEAKIRIPNAKNMDQYRQTIKLQADLLGRVKV
jgi:hypothetical protein